jgi:hypothetical protein
VREWLESNVPVLLTMLQLLTIRLQPSEEESQTPLLPWYVRAKDPIILIQISILKIFILNIGLPQPSRTDYWQLIDRTDPSILVLLRASPPLLVHQTSPHL